MRIRIGNGSVDLGRVLAGLETAGEVASTLRRLQNGAERPRSRNGRPRVPREVAREYGAKHGGHDGWGRPPIRSGYGAPDEVDGEPWLVELGAISRIGYTTAKTDDGDEDDGPWRGRLTEWIHDFESPRPLLCFSRSGLVIARGRSSYTVEDEGITG